MEQQTETPTLNINDLLSVVKIIDACSERGACLLYTSPSPRD